MARRPRGLVPGCSASVFTHPTAEGCATDAQGSGDLPRREPRVAQVFNLLHVDRSLLRGWSTHLLDVGFELFRRQRIHEASITTNLHKTEEPDSFRVGIDPPGLEPKEEERGRDPADLGPVVRGSNRGVPERDGVRHTPRGGISRFERYFLPLGRSHSIIGIDRVTGVAAILAVAAFLIPVVVPGDSSTSAAGQGRTDAIYDSEAEFFDAVFDSVEDLEMIRFLAKQTGGPILDVMSGTGRVSIPLARDGYEVWGVDANASMIQHAQAKADQEDSSVRSRLHFVSGDARSFSLGRTFPLALIPGGSIPHLLREAEREASLRRVAEHLKPNGLLYLAYLNWAKEAPGEISRLVTSFGTLKSAIVPRIRKLSIPGLAHLVSGIMGVWLLRYPSGRVAWVKAIRTGPASELLRVEVAAVDPSTWTLSQNIAYEVLSNGDCNRGRVARFTLAIISKNDMEQLLGRCGFEILRMNGGLHGEPYSSDAEWQVYVCRKTPPQPPSVPAR